MVILHDKDKTEHRLTVNLTEEETKLQSNTTIRKLPCKSFCIE